MFTEEKQKTRHIDSMQYDEILVEVQGEMTIIGVKSYSSALVYVHEIANKTVIVSLDTLSFAKPYKHAI